MEELIGQYFDKDLASLIGLGAVGGAFVVPLVKELPPSGGLMDEMTTAPFCLKSLVSMELRRRPHEFTRERLERSIQGRENTNIFTKDCTCHRIREKTEEIGDEKEEEKKKKERTERKLGKGKEEGWGRKDEERRRRKKKKGKREKDEKMRKERKMNAKEGKEGKGKIRERKKEREKEEEGQGERKRKEREEKKRGKPEKEETGRREEGG
ncbi:hypothetical protein Tco_0535418 [Tanacetum coccineum]